MRLVTAVWCVCVLGIASTAGAATVTVSAGGNLQAAIDAAKPGDTILLAAGAVFTDNYVLPVKGGSSYITIRSAAPDASLPANGVRIDPSYAASLPKVRSTQNGPAFKTAPGATYWRLMFLEILPSVSTSAANLVELGSVGTEQNSWAAVPQHLLIDRCYIHGNPAYAQRRAIALNSGNTQIVNSYISDIKGAMMDTQGIAGWNGPGPFLIENNYIEAASENILFGGSDPSIYDLVPTDITIRRNYITKPMSWITASWTVKNLVELKNADQVTMEGNTIENVWAAGQQGYAIVLTPRNQEGTAPWTIVRNVTIQNNVVRHVAAVLNIEGYDDAATSRQTSNIIFRNNLAYDVSASYSSADNPGNGWFAVIGNGPRDITIDHNTIDNSGDDTLVFYEAISWQATTQMYGITLTNNLLRDNLYGIFGTNSQEGNLTLNTFAPGATVLRNAIGGGDPNRYPAGNDYPTLTQWLADFVNRAGADYTLRSTSLSRGAATDGTDIGVNVPALNAALNASTSAPAPAPAPAPGSSPSPYSGSAFALPGRIEAENYDVGGDTVSFHDTTAGNEGGVYRSDDVDIRSTTDTSGSYNLKAVRAGEWVGYTVNIASAGTYTLTLRLASKGSGGTIHLTIDGTNVSGSLALPDTGGWDTWQTFTKTGIALPAGRHFLKIKMDANGSAGTIADINWLEFASPTTATLPPPPTTGSLPAVPGRIEAENYNSGGEGVGYHDTTAGNEGGVYRFDDVDIRTNSDGGTGYNLKAVRAGEWLAYSINVASTGTYSIDLRVASNGGGGTVHFTLDGVKLTGAIVLPNTGGWNNWTTVTTTGVPLSAGQHLLRLKIDTNGENGTAADINWLAIR